MENANSIYFSVMRLPVNGWHRGKTTWTDHHHHFVTGTDFPWDSGSAHPWRQGWMCCWKPVLSYMDKRENKVCYLFPVQQLHSSLVTWIPVCFGYASACAPVYTQTHTHTHVRTKHLHNILQKRHLTTKAGNWCFTSLNLDSFCTPPCWTGRSLYPEDLKTASEKVSSAVGGKLGPPFLELRPPTVSQETALISGGKAPIVLISAVQGACWVGGRGTGLATPVAGAWLGFRPEPGPSSALPTAGGLLGIAGSQFSFWTAKRGVRVPEETFLFSEGFQSTNNLLPWGWQDNNFY